MHCEARTKSVLIGRVRIVGALTSSARNATSSSSLKDPFVSSQVAWLVVEGKQTRNSFRESREPESFFQAHRA